MRDHVKGRRHQQAVGAMERRKALARCSLYCHGFHPSTHTDVLRSYFQRFGPVTRIMVETQRVRGVGMAGNVQLSCIGLSLLQTDR